MKYFALLALTASTLCAAQYQACLIVTQTGDLICGKPQDRQGAEMQALVYNATAQGQVVAWTRKVPKHYKPAAEQQPSAPVIVLPSQPSDGPDGPQPQQQGKPLGATRGVAGE